MTEEVYAQPLRSFRSSARPAPVFTVPVLARGRAALEEINKELGLAFDEQARARVSSFLIGGHYLMHVSMSQIARMSQTA